jgi:predicted DCC family thiol-disulfide oxidoreductase YuxK
MGPDQHRTPDLPVLLYDEDCGFCRWTVAWVLRRDRRGEIAVAPIQSAAGAELLAGMDPERRLESWHLALPDGSVRSAGAGFAPLAALVGRWPLFARLAGRFPRAADTAYRLVAGSRGLVGRLVPRSAGEAADRTIAGRRL